MYASSSVYLAASSVHFVFDNFFNFRTNGARYLSGIPACKLHKIPITHEHFLLAYIHKLIGLPEVFHTSRICPLRGLGWLLNQRQIVKRYISWTKPVAFRVRGSDNKNLVFRSFKFHTKKIQNIAYGNILDVCREGFLFCIV